MLSSAERFEVFVSLLTEDSFDIGSSAEGFGPLTASPVSALLVFQLFGGESDGDAVNIWSAACDVVARRWRGDDGQVVGSSVCHRARFQRATDGSSSCRAGDD